MREIDFVVNGKRMRATVAPHARLLDVLREDCGLTGTKEGCGEGECGACTILVDGLAVNSCLFPALEAAGAQVTTIEGLESEDGGLSQLQEAFVSGGGTQCGFCTPGMVMSLHALLEESSDPDDDAIRDAMTGNLCRCTGYVQIVEAVREAAKARGS